MFVELLFGKIISVSENMGQKTRQHWLCASQFATGDRVAAQLQGCKRILVYNESELSRPKNQWSEETVQELRREYVRELRLEKIRFGHDDLYLKSHTNEHGDDAKRRSDCELESIREDPTEKPADHAVTHSTIKKTQDKHKHQDVLIGYQRSEFIERMTSLYRSRQHFAVWPESLVKRDSAVAMISKLYVIQRLWLQ